MNHFYALGAELLEKFLICGECNVPIGFTHQLNCSVREESEKNFKWKKTAFDDKFITFDMRFSFSELFDAPRRKEIIKLIKRSTSKQIRIGNRSKTSLPLSAKSSWPGKWNRGCSKARRVKFSRNRRAYPVHIIHPPIFNPSAWTPHTSEVQNFINLAFCSRK